MTHKDDAITLETGPDPQFAVIWLHGLGADGFDFVPIVKELQTLGLPQTRFIFPHAEMIPVSINGGYVMRAWYDIRYEDLQRHEDETGIRKSQQRIEALLQSQIDSGIPSERIVLAGFSQGGAITYQAGLRSKHKLAGLICLSTYMPCQDSFAAERDTINESTPILACHGIEDPVVPLSRGEQACTALKQLGYAVQWKTYAMPHSVCAEEIQDISSFLKEVLC